MANLFDRTYEQLTALREDFTTSVEVEDFFDGFLIALTAAFNNAITRSAWTVERVPYSGKIEDVPAGKKISTEATLRVESTKSAFDIDADFDLVNPKPQRGWEKYEFLGTRSAIIVSMYDYLINYAKKGIDLSKTDARYSDVSILINNVPNFIEVPYAYKYDGSKQPPKVSNFAPKMIADFEIKLEYVEANNTSANANVPTIPRALQQPTLAFDGPITKYGILDSDFEYEERDLTEKYRELALKYDSPEELAKAFGFDAEKAKSVVVEVKFKTFEFEDPKLYQGDSFYSKPHYITWKAESPNYPCYLFNLMSFADAPIKVFSNTTPEIPKDFMLAQVESVKIYIKDDSKDATDVVNKFAEKIWQELDADGTSATEVKLKKFLDGLSWKAEFRTSGDAVVFNGIGYTDRLKEVLIDNKRKATKLIILSGDF